MILCFHFGSTLFPLCTPVPDLFVCHSVSTSLRPCTPIPDLFVCHSVSAFSQHFNFTPSVLVTMDKRSQPQEHPASRLRSQDSLSLREQRRLSFHSRKAQRWIDEINSAGQRDQFCDDPRQRCANDRGIFGRIEVGKKYVVLVKGPKWSYLMAPYCKLCGKWVLTDVHFYTKLHLHKMSSQAPCQPWTWKPIPGEEVQDLDCANHMTFTAGTMLTPGIDRQRACQSQKDKVKGYRERACLPCASAARDFNKPKSPRWHLAEFNRTEEQKREFLERTSKWLAENPQPKPMWQQRMEAKASQTQPEANVADPSPGDVVGIHPEVQQQVDQYRQIGIEVEVRQCFRPDIEAARRLAQTTPGAANFNCL